MNTLRRRSIVRATAVLLLFVGLMGLLALPGMTAGLAQSEVDRFDAGDFHVCTLDSAGKVSCSGWDSHGQVSGRGGVDKDDQGNEYRKLVAGGKGTYSQVSAGRWHTCALTPAGKAECWGRDKDGQSAGTLNDATHTGGRFSAYKQISAGGWHTCAVKKNREVDCWGGNESGQAEDQKDRIYEQVSAGWNFSCALTRDGAIDCWGNNDHGQAPPDRKVGPYIQVSAGQAHTCAIKQNGDVECWGFEAWYKDLQQQIGPYYRVSAGGAHTCAWKLDGSVDCWGKNTEGQIEAPQLSATQISVGGWHTCALTPAGAVDCWGDNSWGQADDQTGPYTQVDASKQYVCALTPAEAVECWGYSNLGQARDQTGPYTQVSASNNHTCALTPAGAVDCWGENWDGQADDQTGPYTQVSAGYWHTCALTPAGAVDCWGANYHGQAADQTGPYTQVSATGNRTCALTPAGAVDCWGPVLDDALTRYPYYKVVSAGRDFTCGWTRDDSEECWGNTDTRIKISEAAWPGGPSSKATFTVSMTGQSQVYWEEFSLAAGESKEIGAPLPIGQKFTITQELDDGYTAAIQCDGQNVVSGSSVEVNPVLNDTVTCTFTNTHVPPNKDNVPKADGESIAYTASQTESNRNSSFNQADKLSLYPQSYGTAIKGVISPAGDVDFFKLTIHNPGDLEPGGGVLFDIDADNSGSDLDATLCVYDGNRALIGCNDDADGLDPMLYVPNCGPADVYYVEVRGYADTSVGDYVLSIDAELVIVSPHRSGRVGGLQFAAPDILARTSIENPIQYKWIQFFDASDLGIIRNIVAFDMRNSCPDRTAGLAVKINDSQRITDSTGRSWRSTPHDVIAIDVGQFGPATTGEVEPDLILDGSTVGLTTRGERIDAITYMGENLLVSTVGSARLPDGSGGTFVAQDEDLVYLVSGAPQPAWEIWFDGSEVPGLANEDLFAASYKEAFGRTHWVLYYLIEGRGRVNGFPASQRVLCQYQGLGSASCQPSPVAPFALDALD